MTTDTNHQTYFFDDQKRKVFFSEEELPQKKTRIYQIIPRKHLIFNEFYLKTKKKLKKPEILTIQRGYIPFNKDFTNLLYYTQKKKERHYIFWVSEQSFEGSNYTNEFPESFIFKCPIEEVKAHNIFVFERYIGIEIIYFNQNQFFSLFRESGSKVQDAVETLIKRFSLKDNVKILSEIEIEGIGGKYPITYLQSDDRILINNYFPIYELHSSLTKEKKSKKISDISDLTGIGLNIAIGLGLILLLISAFFYGTLVKEKNFLKKDFNQLDNIMGKSDLLEIDLMKANQMISDYPNHMVYLKEISKKTDAKSYFTNYSFLKGKIVLKGFSQNSRNFLAQLKKSKMFKKVDFASAVKKDSVGKNERFEIVITYE